MKRGGTPKLGSGVFNRQVEVFCVDGLFGF